MFCSKCGCDNVLEAQFCGICGTPLTADKVNLNPAAKPSKSHKKLWIAAAVLALVLVIVICSGFLLRLQIIKKISPEKYTQLAFAQTLAGARDEADSILDLTKYKGEAVSHIFAVDIEGADVEGTLKYDSANEKALLDVSVNDSGNSYDNNQLYISPDLIAVSLPDITDDSDYLTIDPATFAEEWEDNGWDDYVSIPNIQDLVHSLFGKGGSNEDSKAFINDSKALTDELYKSSVFSSDGSVDESIGSKTLKLDVMTYTFSEDSLNDFYQDYLSLLQDSPMMDNGSYTQNLDQSIEQLAEMTMNDDVVIHLYIDQQGYLRKINCEEFKVSYQGTDINLAFDMELVGDGCPTDEINTVINLEADGYKYDLKIGSETSYSDGIYKASFDIKGKSGGNYDYQDSNITIAFDVEWDKKDTAGNNLDINMKIKNGSYNNWEWSLSGSLTDSDKGTSLSDVSVSDNYGSTSFDFEYSITKIKPSEIAVDTSDSTPLLEDDSFLEYMENYYYWY